tara:strand:- start:98 stop:394 length:297 start_codon:yes stop_codon:yes gene_type:complete
MTFLLLSALLMAAAIRRETSTRATNARNVKLQSQVPLGAQGIWSHAMTVTTAHSRVFVTKRPARESTSRLVAAMALLKRVNVVTETVPTPVMTATNAR